MIKIVDFSGNIYFDNILNLNLDSGEVYLGLPGGYIERVYCPGKYHYLHTDDTAVPQGLNWLEGNAYIEACEQLIAAKAAREAAD